MQHLKAQAAALADWVTLHPLFTLAGAVLIVLLARLIVRRLRRAG